MTSLRDRFATLDQRPMPDLWSDVERRVASLDATEPVRSIAVRGRLGRTGSADRRLGLVMAAALVAIALAGAVAVGSGFVSLPSVVAPPSPSSTASPLGSTPPSTPTASTPPPASTTPMPSGPISSGVTPWIVFQVSAPGPGHDSLLWAMRSDGSASHEIGTAGYMTVAWSRDGSRLLLNDGRIHVANVGADIGPFVDAGITVPGAAQWEAFDFAPDGEHVAFVQRTKCPPGTAGAESTGIVLAAFTAETAGADCWVISTLDLRTGHRHDLRQTQVMDQTAHENLALELPAWSPDGTKIAYARVDERLGTGELWIVNADGSNPAKVELDADASVSGPRWSPDGTRISFTSVTWLSGGESDSAIGVVELATGHVTRLTVTPDPAVQHACCADWIDDAHLRVQAAVSGDGTRFWAVPLDGDPVGAALLADLTDAVAGDALPGRPSMRSAPGDPGRTFFWQPTGR